MSSVVPPDDPRLLGVDPASRRDVWVKKLLYPAHTIPTALAPVMVGAGLAVHHEVFAIVPIVGAFLFGWLVQLGGVLADNYFNLKRYRNDTEHPALVHALDTDLLTLNEVRNATAGVFTLAAICGLALIGIGGVPVILVGIGAIVVSILYSLELTDLPLHDLYFFIFFGPVSVAGTYYLQAAYTLADPFPLWFPPESLPLVAVLAGVPIGAITTAILVVDNIRDLDFDRQKNDRTLAIVIGERWSRIEYHGLLLVAYLAPFVLWATTGIGPFALLPLLSLPFAAYVARRMQTARTYIELHPMSPRTGQVLLVFAVLFGIGLAI